MSAPALLMSSIHCSGLETIMCTSKSTPGNLSRNDATTGAPETRVGNQDGILNEIILNYRTLNSVLL